MIERVILYFTLFVALVFAVMPLPELVQAYRPDWLLLVVAYWGLALPHRVNVGTAFTMGLMLDVLKGSVLGANALAMSVIIYVVALQFQKIRNFSVWQQAIIIALLSLMAKLFEYWMTYLAIDVDFDREQLWAVLINFILWPWVFFLMRRIRRHFRIR
ncbi:rod shape-determining protein MreD [Echinimonas agarilytica]|uniref:Rod shape-determining protein MreD n=1 Tax=Echinimonas agarilytica TaxID=1215918 RepID=A0AA42B6L2_9GAMM|nr:rod shape-determining protein MreD [Echinimonas agarilytica]MCM2678596.1 rod shape-determining protein MreD [Echinimonas agarilytica]